MKSQKMKAGILVLTSSSGSRKTPGGILKNYNTDVLAPNKCMVVFTTWMTMPANKTLDPFEANCQKHHERRRHCEILSLLFARVKKDEELED